MAADKRRGQRHLAGLHVKRVHFAQGLQVSQLLLRDSEALV
jgi:hypothetical protein